MWDRTSTGSGAVDAPIGTLVCGNEEEFFPARASAPDCSLTDSRLEYHKNFIVLDFPDRMLSVDIASMASGYKIFNGVVSRISVQMINNQRSVTSHALPSIVTPCNTCTTPVALMTTRANAVIKNSSMLKNQSIFAGQWVIGAVQVAVSSHNNMVQVG